MERGSTSLVGWEGVLGQGERLHQFLAVMVAVGVGGERVRSPPTGVFTLQDAPQVIGCGERAEATCDKVGCPRWQRFQAVAVGGEGNSSPFTGSLALQVALRAIGFGERQKGDGGNPRL